MNDQEVRLTHVLEQLIEGRISTEDAAALVRKIKFPVRAPKTTWQRMQNDAGGDLEVPERGSFFPVSQAYMSGRIDAAQYRALAEAAAEAMKGETSGSKSEGQAPSSE